MRNVREVYFPVPTSESLNVTSGRPMAQQAGATGARIPKHWTGRLQVENMRASSCAHTIIYCIESARRWRSLPRLSSPRQGEDQKTVGNAATPSNTATWNRTQNVVGEYTYVLYLMSTNSTSVMIPSLLYMYSHVDIRLQLRTVVVTGEITSPTSPYSSSPKKTWAILAIVVRIPVARRDLP